MAIEAATGAHDAAPARRVSHDPFHPDMPHEVTVIKGRRFPTCRGCKGISFALVHAAKHVGEIDHLTEPDMAGGGTR